jgi:hypothetical protein
MKSWYPPSFKPETSDTTVSEKESEETSVSEKESDLIKGPTRFLRL